MFISADFIAVLIEMYFKWVFKELEFSNQTLQGKRIFKIWLNFP